MAWNDHFQMAKMRPLYAIWSRGQMTASRILTSVTTATSVRLTLNVRNITVVCVVQLFMCTNFLLFYLNERSDSRALGILDRFVSHQVSSVSAETGTTLD